MQIVSGFFYVIVGVFFIWMGSFQIIANMVPHDIGIKFAEQHGAWVRENIFNFPSIKEETK